MKPISHTLASIITWLDTTAPKGKGFLVPISGGSDSALCFWLCSKARPEITKGIFSGNTLRSQEWFESVGNIIYIPSPANTTSPETMRWALFLEQALQHKQILVGSRNRTEDVLGTYSLASRIAVYFPIVHLWKSEILNLCKEIGVPEEVLISSKRADPECGRPQELADIPTELIDKFAQTKTNELTDSLLDALDVAQKKYLESLYQSNLFKSHLPERGF
ncbi:MAG: hypothetical protein HZA36_01450 [Parcubacteria group bacterium]|nr:hypothetical protein [Parcubacteria group bacterium]